VLEHLGAAPADFARPASLAAIDQLLSKLETE